MTQGHCNMQRKGVGQDQDCVCFVFYSHSQLSFSLMLWPNNSTAHTHALNLQTNYRK